MVQYYYEKALYVHMVCYITDHHPAGLLAEVAPVSIDQGPLQLFRVNLSTPVYWEHYIFNKTRMTTSIKAKH